MNGPFLSTCAPAAERVLYVDDEALARKYFALAAGPEYEVLQAASVDEALMLLADPCNAVAVVVSDYRMPGRNGAELLRHLERAHPHIVRILATAHAEREVLLETVNSAEVFRILEKPLTQDAVRQVLRAAGARARERSARRQSMNAIEETLAFLAHELNTPLAAISNFARGITRRVGTLEPGPLQAEIGSAADLMHDNARYCLSVLASFAGSVKLANASAAARPLAAQPSARQLIEALLDAYPLDAGQRALVEVEAEQDFAVCALPHCVALVLSSVLANALRALAGRADARLRFVVRGGAAPRIEVRDNGPGIAPAVLARLLLDPVTMHADSGGNGWGLIFCQRIMQSFGGNISVQSEPGRSTTVALNFPATKKE